MRAVLLLTVVSLFAFSSQITDGLQDDILCVPDEEFYDGVEGNCSKCAYTCGACLPHHEQFCRGNCPVFYTNHCDIKTSPSKASLGNDRKPVTQWFSIFSRSTTESHPPSDSFALTPEKLLTSPREKPFYENKLVLLSVCSTALAVAAIVALAVVVCRYWRRKYTSEKRLRNVTDPLLGSGDNFTLSCSAISSQDCVVVTESECKGHTDRVV